VATLSSGDEIVRPGSALRPGQVYDAITPMLQGLIAGMGAGTADLGVLPDDQGIVRRRLPEAARPLHGINTSGGASRGRAEPAAARKIIWWRHSMPWASDTCGSSPSSRDAP